MEGLAPWGVVMAYQLMQDCNDMHCEMSSTEHAVLMVLCRFADEDGANCYPSVAEIARCSHFAEKPVRKALAVLQSGGWIGSTQNPGKKRFFEINAEKIKKGVAAAKSQPLVNVAPLVDRPGVVDRQGGTDQPGVVDRPLLPLSIDKDTPGQSTSRKEHIKEQEKDREVSCALPAGSSAADLCPSVDEFGLTNDFPVEAVKPKKQTKKTKAVTHAFNLETLPEDWAVYCKEVRPDLDPARVFSAFKAYWTMGRGKGTLRADKSWFQSWANWVKKENEGRGRSQTTEVNGLLPDQSRNPFYFPDGGRPNRKTTEVPRDYDATAEASDLVGRMLG